MFNTVRFSFTQLANNILPPSFILNTTTCYDLNDCLTLMFDIFSHVSQMPPNREPNFTQMNKEGGLSDSGQICRALLGQ